jgi:protein-S-isoprenylcysteine O-methyltransferase Ste14
VIVDGLRLYLLAGLVLHKGIWEIWKRRPTARGSAPERPASPIARLLKGLKIAILVGLVAQTFLPTILPIVDVPRPLRVAGVGLYTLGLCIAIFGRVQLGDNWADIEAAQIVRQQAVVATGLYRHIRHPIYIGDLVMLLGFELSLNSWLLLGVGALVPYVLWSAVREERLLSAQLPGYDAYCARTWRFVPFVM